MLTTVDIPTMATVVVPTATLFWFIVRLTIKGTVNDAINKLWSELNETFRRSAECELIIQRERHDSNNLIQIKANELEKRFGK